MAYPILTLDGGGVRGVYTAVLLDRLAAALPGTPFLARPRLIAGTSTGGILAMAVAAGMTPADLIGLYRDHGRAIFHRSVVRTALTLDGLIGADYPNAPLLAVLRQWFGTKTLDDLSPRRVLVPSFDLDGGQDDPPAVPRAYRAKFFHNYPGPDSDGAERIVDVAMRTTAAPTYFPTYQHYCDGGVVANNPAMAAVAQALDPGTGGQSLADLRLLSLGTGTVPAYIPGHDHDWGVAQWARPLVSALIDGVMGVADYQCRQLLGDRYCRLSPTLPRAVDLDDAAAIPELIDWAKAVDLGPTVAWLAAHF